jgi:hypothetical protein
MKDIVVAEVRGMQLALHAGLVVTPMTISGRREPHGRRHMGLRFRRNRLRRDVQVQAVSPQELAMLGGIEHRRLDMPRVNAARDPAPRSAHRNLAC